MNKAQDLLDQIQQEEIIALKNRVNRIEKITWYLASVATIQIGQNIAPIIATWLGVR